jgi:hypothetical protein
LDLDCAFRYYLIGATIRIKRQYGDPLALVHDVGKGILLAVETVFNGIPDFSERVTIQK